MHDHLNEENQSVQDVPWMNRLPYELIARIFVLVEAAHRHARLTSRYYSGFHKLASQICWRWREVALNTPELWNYLFIYCFPIPENDLLYLSRSGTCLLHVDLVLSLSDKETTSLPGPQDHCMRDLDLITRMLNIMVCLAQNGAHGTRWESLIINSQLPGALYDAINEMNDSFAMPNLKAVSFHCTKYRELLYGYYPSDYLKSIVDTSLALELGARSPLLRSVILDDLPSSFIFNRSKPLVSNLRRLSLSCGRNMHPVEGLHAILSACPQLESLSLDKGSAMEASLTFLTATPLTVFLPSLRFFSLSLAWSAGWGTYVLRMIDAPGVETFSLYFEREPSALDIFVRFLTFGRVNGVLQANLYHDEHGAGPIFPSLRALSLPFQRLESPVCARLLDAYTSVTKLSLAEHDIKLLSDPSKYLPNLTHLRCSGSNQPEIMAILRDVVRLRKEWGVRLLILELVSSRRTTEEIDAEFRQAIQDGLKVRQVEDWMYGWLGVFDIEDVLPII